MTMVEFAFHSDAVRVKFWATATVLAAPVVLLANWAISTAFGVFDGLPLVGVNVTPLQAFVIGVYVPGSFGVVMFCWGEWNVARSRATKTWPTTPAIVTSSRVAERDVYRRGMCYRLEAEYRYKVQGVEYTSDRVQFGNTWLDDEDFVRKLVAKYPQGAQVAVHYDPSDPTSAVLDASDEVVAELESDYRGGAYLDGRLSGDFFRWRMAAPSVPRRELASRWPGMRVTRATRVSCGGCLGIDWLASS